MAIARRGEAPAVRHLAVSPCGCHPGGVQGLFRVCSRFDYVTFLVCSMATMWQWLLIIYLWIPNNVAHLLQYTTLDVFSTFQVIPHKIVLDFHWHMPYYYQCRVWLYERWFIDNRVQLVTVGLGYAHGNLTPVCGTLHMATYDSVVSPQ